MDFKKWLPTLFAIGGAGLTAAMPPIQQAIGTFATHHPVWASFIAAASIKVANLWTSPLQKKQDDPQQYLPYANK